METPARRGPCIIDATLREGVQAPHSRLGEAASVEIAALLVRSGVDVIECGHPAVSKLEFDRIRAVRLVTPGTPLLCHARAVVEDVEQVARVGADWVGIFLGVNDMSLATKLHRATPEQALRRVQDATKAARQSGLKVRFTVEDTSRTPSARAFDAYTTALEAGASRLCFADTVGALAPREVEGCIRQLVAAFPGIPIEVHLHDDRGLALANGLAAIEAGATWISTSVNGLGERCGIVDLAAMLANLEYLGLRALENPAVLHELATRVGVHSRSPPDSRRPVVGEHAFTHTARLHRLAVQSNPRCYEWIEPAKLGRRRTCVPTSQGYATEGEQREHGT
jgi:2-isopropylmalate synthase